MSKVTISTVAEEAGVSVATVSRVINNEPVVKEETAERAEAFQQRARLRDVPCTALGLQPDL